MRQNNDPHVAVPGLAVVEVAAASDETAFAVQELLAARCAIASADRTTREPGVRLRFFLDLHQDADTQACRGRRPCSCPHQEFAPPVGGSDSRLGGRPLQGEPEGNHLSGEALRDGDAAGE
ncbi:DUF6207 family protein [Streptomyces sp. NPDC059441]|uniref:DUF6207 family protein n=1 Tax=Streptomyces sp. NPDC059441 TaxID=3346829 RepID=UPI0036A9EECC